MNECKGDNCPVEETIQFLGQKWTLLLIKKLSENKTVRFNELEKELNISPKTLSKRLKELEEKNFILKETFKEIPPRVEYSLTKNGKEIGKSIGELNKLLIKLNK